MTTPNSKPRVTSFAPEFLVDDLARSSASPFPALKRRYFE